MVVAMVALSGFFSSAETALTTVNRIRVQARAEEGEAKAKILLKVLDSPSKMLSTILIGNNIVNMAASSLMTTLTIKLFGSVFVGLTTGMLTLSILLFGEITPKTLASLEAEKIALSYAASIHALTVVMSPLVWLVGILGNTILRMMHVDPDHHSSPVTEREIRTLVAAGEEDGALENEERLMIDNVFDFGDSYAKDVMVPRIDMTMVDVHATLDELMEIFRQDMHTRFPVYENDTDNVIGVINIKDIILLSRDQPFSIRDILRDAYFTYEFKRTADLLIDMRRSQTNIAIVLDEYGSTSGLVTLENLLEEIVGEIRDEYDQDEKEDIVEILPGREYKALGAARISDINETLSLSLYSEDNESIAGYIIEKLDRLPPQVGDSVIPAAGVRLVVDETEKNRIEAVHIWLDEPDRNLEETKS
ncbi:MAG: HlyC/CorC family transporter [Blautia sp.]|nr:HlyC/CorC family transporter [Blautia sp.]